MNTISQLRHRRRRQHYIVQLVENVPGTAVQAYSYVL